jgi:energy-converting hydrogenase Eha subunit F
MESLTLHVRRLQFTMPVEVDWSKHDTSLVGRFWAAHPGEQAEAAEISDRILVYHRGVDTVTLLCHVFCCLLFALPRPLLWQAWQWHVDSCA